MKLLFGILLIASIQTDGIISVGEWAEAEQYDLGDGNKVLLKKDDNILYVALTSKNSFWSHFYLSDGKRVKVMHASAALGAIDFVKEGELWRTDDKSFVYELRESEYEQGKFDAYYSKYGWVANNNNLGDKKTIEAKIDLGGFDPKFFACVIATPGKYYSYPVGLDDNTVLTRLVQGYAVDSLKFDPSKWRKM